MNKTNISFKITKKQAWLALAALIIFGGIIRLIVAVNTVHLFDINYYLNWAKGAVNDGLFNVYDSVTGEYAVDYPPLFLFPLYITGLILKNDSVLNCDGCLMLTLKMWQIIFDLATIAALYIVFRKRNKILALAAAAMWAVNPSIIYSSSCWGQTDSIMIFLLLVTLAAFDERKPVLGCFVYALACLTKFQCAYFAPVVLLFLFFGKHKAKQVVTAIAGAVLTVCVVFLPFMLCSGAELPFKVYFGGLAKWPYAALYAFNYFGMLNLNYVPDSAMICPLFSASMFGTFMTIMAVGFTAIIYFTTNKKCPYMLSFFIMNTIFMFASRMHDRYQIPVIIFILLAAAKHKSPKLFIAYILTTVMTFLNAFIAFNIITNSASQTPAPWMIHRVSIVTTMSLVNLLVYFVTLYITLDFFYDITGKLKKLLFPSGRKLSGKTEKKAEPVRS